VKTQYAKKLFLGKWGGGVGYADIVTSNPFDDFEIQRAERRTWGVKKDRRGGEGKSLSSALKGGQRQKKERETIETASQTLETPGNHTFTWEKNLCEGPGGKPHG